MFPSSWSTHKTLAPPRKSSRTSACAKRATCTRRKTPGLRPLRPPSRSLPRKVFLCPPGDLSEGRQQRAARIGERVGDRQWGPPLDRSAHQPRVRQLEETIREHRIADPVDGPGERAETRGSSFEGAQHDADPSLAQKIEGS